MKQTIEVAWESDDVPMIYCPVCGAPVRGLEVVECEHVIFTAIDIVPGFGYMKESEKAYLTEIEETNDTLDMDLVDLAMLAMASPSRMCMKVATSNIGPHGPQGTEFSACFEFKLKE